MNNYLDNRGYNLFIDSISKVELSDLKNKLKIVPYQFNASGEEILKATYRIYEYTKDEKYIIIPKYYGIKNFGKPDNDKYNICPNTISFKRELRDYQVDIITKCVDYMLNNGGGLLSVPCGRGKTIMAIYIAHKLGVKTLIVVHKSFLLDQWYDRINEFTNAKVGKIRQNVCDIDNKDIVIGMIQTISKREYNDKIFNTFGLSVYDEAHHLPTKTFTKALRKISTKYTLSLTATPERSDNLIKLMYWYTGEVIHMEKDNKNKTVCCKVFMYKCKSGYFREITRMRNNKKELNTLMMVKNLCEINERTKLIVNIICAIMENPKRKIIILAKQKKYLNSLMEAVNKKVNKDIEDGKLLSNEINVCSYTGSTKPKDRHIVEQIGDVIFATYDMAKEGLDISHLNTVIFATPMKAITQTIGRIMRKTLYIGDLRPLIVDIADDLSVFTVWRNDRKKMYFKNKYEVNDYYYYYDNFISKKEYYNNEDNSDDENCEGDLDNIFDIDTLDDSLLME